MISRLISPRESYFLQVKEEVKRAFDRDPSLFGLDNPNTYVIGRFDKDELTGFGIFEDYRDPKFHIGNPVDEEFKKRMRVLDNYMLYNVTLIHEFSGKEDHSSVARGVIGAMHDILGMRNGRFCLYITLMEKANAPALEFFESLGFRFTGSRAYYMSIPIQDAPLPRGRWHFQSLSTIDPATLASAYSEVFGGELDWYSALRLILSTRGFSPELSFVALTREEKELIGFCLLQQTSSREVYIMAVGVRGPYRGKGVTDEGYSYLKHKLFQRGIEQAVLVTASEKLVSHFSTRHDAVLNDTVLWYAMCE